MYAENIGDFEQYGVSTGQSCQQLERTKLYDQALDLIVNSKFIQQLPADTIVQAEMLYIPMAQETADGLKFVHIAYDPAKLGSKMTLVPLSVKQYSTGKPVENATAIISELVAASNADIKFVSTRIPSFNVNLLATVEQIVQHQTSLRTALASRKRNCNKKQLAKQALAHARNTIQTSILKHATGTDLLGPQYEGLVITMPSGMNVKVTSSTMQASMATKNSKRYKTAVVTVGSFVGHRGHQRVVDSVFETAKQLGGDPYVYISNKVGQDDPIPGSVKLQTWHILYPDNKDRFKLITSPDGTSTPSPLKKIEKELVLPADSPYNKIVLLVGTDRVEGFRKALQHLERRMKDPVALAKFGGTQDQVAFEVIEVPRGVENGGITQSFTELRNILKDSQMLDSDKMKYWVSAFDGILTSDYIKRLMLLTACNK